MRGKESLVLLRPAQHGLMLHTLYFADEVRDFGEIDTGETAKIREGELELAVRLIDELSHEEFTPAPYEDEYRRRVLDLVNSKGEGKAVTAVGPEVQRTHVIDLMDALKQSLARRAAAAAPPAPPRRAHAEEATGQGGGACPRWPPRGGRPRRCRPARNEGAMTLPELLATLKALGATLTLQDDDAVTIARRCPQASRA